MPGQNKTQERIFKVISRVMKVPSDQITQDTSPDTVPTWDSLQHMNLIVALEEEFGVQFEPDHIVEMQSAGLIEAVLKEMGTH